MSPAPRSDGRPGASLETLKKRAQLLKGLRAFFDARGVMEVDPPLLSRSAAPDVHLHSLSTVVRRPGTGAERRWLPTSPEYPLKRLLCAGLGDCYALGHVFRDGDESSRHQPEFMMLEWYRLGFDLEAIMDETTALLREMLPGWQAERYRYDELFADFAGIEGAYDAHASAFRQAMEAAGKSVAGVDENDRILWRQLVLTEIIEPQLAERDLVLVWGWPAEEAALAALSADGRMALRFEVFARGLELANGYEELRLADDYRARFAAWNAERQARGLPEMPVDEALLAALEAADGLPACAGVALGVDRLLMVQLGETDIRRVVPFAFGDA